MSDKFITAIGKSYTFNDKCIVLGAPLLNNTVYNEVAVSAPLKMFNRHGLIAGATGTGKTKTLQRLAESLSKNGVSVLMMDIKGDLSGISQKGNPDPKLNERIERLNIKWKPQHYPVEFLTISEQNGVRLRATVLEFGPVLFSKILELNDTQAGVVSLLFKYCDDKNLPLIDLKDFKKTLQFLTNEGRKEIELEYGKISSATASTIIRKIIEIEEQGAELFFGESSFEVDDLIRIDDRGLGYINIMRLSDIQDKPKLFSTFMLSLLAEIYATFPEEGDIQQPKLVIFIDEAHLIFKEASKTLLSQLETIIKLIRSKGVGIFFCTQMPTDIPAGILSQLGMKVQHALRAFTASDRKSIKVTSENYPASAFYKVDELLTAVGIGEALITVLNDNGNPTELVHTLLCPPESRMDTITEAELNAIVSTSVLTPKYNKIIDRESAYELLTKKMQDKINESETTNKPPGKQEKSVVEKVVASPMARTIVKELTRGLLGALGLGTTRRANRSGKFF